MRRLGGRLVRGADPLAGKTAVVTGGASGIGRALGAELVGRGAHVVLADAEGDAAERAAAELRAAGTDRAGSVVAREVDVRDEAAVRAVVDDTLERHGRLDYMFNNAGIVLGGRTHEMTGAHWERIIAVNLGGVVNGVLAAYPAMVRQGHGHIVNTASTAGLVPAVLVVAYSATKSAVVGLSAALRPEAAIHGVRVSALCPGPVDTPILDRPQPADLPPRSTMTGREYMRRVGLSPMPADRFAHLALRRVVRDQGIIVVPWSARALWRLQRLSPAVMDRVGRVAARRVLRELPS